MFFRPKNKTAFPKNKGRRVHNQADKGSRLSIIVILILTVLLPAYFWFKNNLAAFFQSLNQGKEYHIINPLSEEKPITDFFPKLKVGSVTELENLFKNELKDVQGRWGLYFQDLETGKEINYQSREVFQAASVVKIIPMVLYYKMADEGKRSLNDIYVLKNDDIQVYGTGSMQYQEPGKKYTYEDILQLAGKQSDNTAEYILKKNLGEDQLAGFMTENGLLQSNLDNVESTPCEIGQFFAKIYRDEVLNLKFKNKFYDNLTDTLFEDRIPRGVPSGIRVVHKIGNGMNRSYNDCGLVFSSHPFVFCVMDEEASESEALSLIPKLARTAYEWSIKGD